MEQSIYSGFFDVVAKIHLYTVIFEHKIFKIVELVCVHKRFSGYIAVLGNRYYEIYMQDW